MTTEQVVRDTIVKWLTPAALAVTVFGGIFVGIRYIVKSEVQSIRDDVRSIRTDVSNLQVANKDTNSKIDGLLKEALERAFPSPNSSTKTISETLPQMRSVLRLAKLQSIKIDPKILSRYGNQVAKAVATDPSIRKGAVSVLNELMASRSLQNQDAIPVSKKSFAHPSRNVYFYIGAVYRSLLPNEPVPFTFAFTTDKVVPADRAYVYAELGRPPSSSPGFAFLALDGHDRTEFTLDGFRIRHVIFRNARIVYDGGPVNLQDVYFVNCTFEIKQRAARKSHLLEAFTKAVLESPSTSFAS